MRDWPMAGPVQKWQTSAEGGAIVGNLQNDRTRVQPSVAYYDNPNLAKPLDLDVPDTGDRPLEILGEGAAFRMGMSACRHGMTLLGLRMRPWESTGASFVGQDRLDPNMFTFIFEDVRVTATRLQFENFAHQILGTIGATEEGSSK